MENKHRMEIEDMLRRYVSLINEVKNIELEIEKLSYNNCVPNKNRVIESLKNNKRKKEIEIEKIDNALAVLDARQRKVIELRYIKPDGLSWNEISNIMRLTDSRCRGIKNDAINKIIPLIFVESKKNITNLL